MRVTRSGKRKRGISTFIATLLLMVLAVAAGVIIYAYVMGYLGNFSMTVPQGNLQVQSVVQNPGNPDELWVYVQNLGKGSVKVDPASTSVYVDGSPKVGVSADPQTLNEGQTSLIKVPIPGVIPSTTITIKIVTADGLFAQTEYKVASATVVAGPLTAPTVAPTPAVVNQGQTSSLGCTVTTTGGTTPYTYQWLQKAPGDTTYSTISGATLSSYGFVTTTSTTTGDWSFELRVTDSIPNVVTSAPITVTVNSGSASNPSVSLAPTTWTMDVGQSKPFTATATGGSGTYTSYAWYVNTVVQSGQTQLTFTYSPASSGSISITVTVTDSLGHTSPTSTPAAVTVGSVLVAPTVTAAPTAVNQGGTSSLTSAAMTTGSLPYTYQWLQEGPSDTAYSPISSATSSSYDFITTGSTDTGAWSFELQVTDGAGITVTSTQATVTVNTGLAVSILPTTSTIDVGQSQLFTSSVNGGVGTPSYQWYLNDTSVSGQTASTYTFTPSTKGTSTIYVKVTDSSIPPVTVQSNTATVTTNYALVAPTVTATPTTIGQGQTSSLTSTPVTTGTSTYTYQWLQKSPTSGTYTAIVGETSISYNFATTGSTTIGVWGFELRVTDSVGVIVTSAPAMVTINNGLVAPLVTAAPTTIGQGQTSSLTSTPVTTGTSPYTYQWLQKGPSDIDYSPIASATSSTYSFVTTTSTTVGSWSFELQVSDSAGAQVTSNPATVTVMMLSQVTFTYTVSGGGTPTAPTVTYVSAGQTLTVTAGPSATVYVDPSSTYTYSPNPLNGGSSSERWQAASTPTGTITSAGTINPTYYHQYSFRLRYSISGSGSPTAPTLTATQFGSSYSPTLTTSSTSYWLDSGQSWSVTNPLTGSGTGERWYSSQTVSGTVSATSPTTAGNSLTFTYYHQYSFQLDYIISGGGSPTAPTLTATQFGSSYRPTLTTSSTSYWLDSGQSWSVTNPLTGTGERWYSSQTVSGTVSATSPTTAGNSLDFTYNHQCSVTFAVSPSGSGSTTPSGNPAWETLGALPIAATYNPGYRFSAWSTTGSITIDNPSSSSATATISGTGTITATFTQNAPQTVTLYPRGVGHYSDLSQSPSSGNHYDKVSETSADGDSTYVYTTSTSTYRDSYTFTSTSATGPITSVTIYVVARGNSGGTASTVARINGSSYYGTTNTLTATYATYSTTYTTNPDTTVAWTWTDINALDAGVRLARSSGQTDARCTQIYVVVTYLTP